MKNLVNGIYNFQHLHGCESLKFKRDNKIKKNTIKGKKSGKNMIKEKNEK